MGSLGGSWKLVTERTKCNANFTPFDKMPKLWFISQFMVFSLYLYREKKSCKSVFLKKLLVSDFDCCKGFPRP